MANHVSIASSTMKSIVVCTTARRRSIFDTFVVYKFYLGPIIDEK